MLWVCIVSACTSCDQTEGKPKTAAEPAGQKKALAPGRDGTRPRLTANMCEMLGMLDEYISRFDKWTGKPRPGVIESFYGEDSEPAKRFEELLQAYREETGQGFRYAKVAEEGGGATFRSEKLSAVINSYYVRDESEGHVGTLDRRVLDEASEECNLAYVEGAYRRFGHKNANAIRVVNGYYKIETLAHVLERLGCKNVRRYTMNAIPASHLVVFQPGGKLTGRLPITQKITPADLAGYEPPD